LIDVLVAAFTIALTFPIYNTFSEAVVSKLLPVTVSEEPEDPSDGEKELIIGLLNEKPPLETEPAGVVTTRSRFPEEAAGATALMLVADATVYEIAGMPPNDTPVVPVKFVPVMVTVVPCVPAVGVKEVMVG
jgi:hypothetical protein